MLPRLFHACLCCLLLGLPAPLLAQLQLRVGSYDNPPKVVSNAQPPPWAASSASYSRKSPRPKAGNCTACLVSGRNACRPCRTDAST